MKIRRLCRSIAVAVASIVATMASAALGGDVSALNELRRADLRLATIGHRLAIANVALCRDRAPVTGMILHAIDQYDSAAQADARAAFGFETPVAVEGVVPGSVAARAGISANDSVVSINHRPIGAADTSATNATVATRDRIVDALAADPAEAPVAMVIRRQGGDESVTIDPSPGCLTLFEVQPGTQLTAEADGRVVLIGGGLLNRFSDDQVAVVVAHELSHNILKHRRRLNAAGVSRGLFRELGRNGRLFRTVEAEADALSVYLLRNAGYDPALAVRFWEGDGRSIDGGIFRSRTHPSSKARARAIAAEIAKIPSAASRPYVPPMIGLRDRPLE